ncbi:MAG TPA: YrdB family protein [Gaiellaceae bacterium]|nr:YrdB family protein [Gaiellaceae bacterium]
MQAASDTLQVVLEVLVLISLASWGWQEGDSIGRWVLAIGVPLAFAVVWTTLLTRFSASKLEDPSRLRLELAIVACAAAALIRIGHPVLSVLLVLLAATQLTLTYVFHQR